MRILIFSVSEFYGAARIPRALQQAGFEVATLCFRDNLLAQTRFVDRRFYLPSSVLTRRLGVAILESLIRAIHAWAPMLIIPGDEPVVRFLYRLVHVAARRRVTGVDERIVALLNASLGDPASFAARINKHLAQATARRLGIRAPAQQAVTTAADALEFAREHGYPVVLKRAFGFGGDGVRVCSNGGALNDAFRFLRAGPGPVRRMSDLARRSLLGPLATSWYPRDNSIDVQAYIPGMTAMYPLIAVAGEILSGYAALKERVHPAPNGPSSVVRFVKQPEMADAARLLMAEFGHSGFASLDFVIHETTGDPYFIECNPRLSPICHLGAESGVDLCEALWRTMTGADRLLPSIVREGEVVALFPQEWIRDPSSPYLRTARHDVPWDDPVLLKALVNSAAVQSGAGRPSNGAGVLKGGGSPVLVGSRGTG